MIGMCIFLKCDRNVNFGWIIVDYGFKFEYQYYVFSGLIVWIMYGYLYIVIIK